MGTGTSALMTDEWSMLKERRKNNNRTAWGAPLEVNVPQNRAVGKIFGGNSGPKSLSGVCWMSFGYAWT